MRTGEKAKLLEKVKKEAGYQNESTESEEEMEQKWRHFFNLALEKQNEGRILHCDD